MKKKLLLITLVLAMAASSCSIAFGVSAFSDITDSKVENAVEVLRLMGVVEGDGAGNYNPDKSLSRAEFTKMAVLALSSDADLSKYSNITIFPDVKPSDWYFKYVNAATKMGFINGLPDGSFAPEKEISVAEAITILLRLIGYSDDIVGGVWPYGQETVAKGLGMMTGISYSSVRGFISRGNAAKLFVNTIMAAAEEHKGGFSKSEKCTLKSIDAAGKKMTVSNQSQPIDTLRSMSATNLIGRIGYVVLYEGKAATFVPSAAVSTSADAAVVIGIAGDTTVLDSLAGRKDYSIYKNGSLITADKLKKNDVAEYNEADNRIIVCDTKLSVYYVNCEGSPEAPTSVTVMGEGNNAVIFDVLACAYPTISKFKPGTNMSIYLSADGQIAAAGSAGITGENNNAVFITDQYGKASLVCGNSVIDLGISVGDNTKLWGQVVRTNGYEAERTKFALASDAVNGTVSKETGKVGSIKIADGAQFYLNGQDCDLLAIDGMTSCYVRENANGEADIVAVYDASLGNISAGKGVVSTMYGGGVFNTLDYYLTIYNKDNPNGRIELTDFYEDDFSGYVVATFRGKYFKNVNRLLLLGTAEKNAINSKLVNTADGTLSLHNDVSCYNLDTKEWTDIDRALVYGREFRLYGLGSMVYVVEYAY